MDKRTRTVGATVVLSASLLAGVLAVFSIAVGTPLLTAALAVFAAVTAAIAFRLGRVE